MCKTEFDNKRKTGRTKTASADKKVIGGGAERKVPHHAGAGRSVQYQWEHFVKIFYVSSLAAAAPQAWQCGGVAVCAGVRSDAGWAVLAGPPVSAIVQGRVSCSLFQSGEDRGRPRGQYR